MSLSIARSFSELMKEAKHIEKDDPSAAESLYKKAIRLEPQDEKPYQRLMAVYRKQKKYEDEIELIEKAIDSFRSFREKRYRQIMGRKKAAITASNALARSSGMNTKKADPSGEPEPIPKWLKRKEVAGQRLKSASSKKKKKNR